MGVLLAHLHFDFMTSPGFQRSPVVRKFYSGISRRLFDPWNINQLKYLAQYLRSFSGILQVDTNIRSFTKMGRTAATLLITLTLLGATNVNANIVPVADANGPYEIFEGNSLTLDATGSFDPDGDPLGFTWDINNDGVFGDATGAVPTVSWSELLALGLAANWFNSLTVRVDDGQLSDVSSSSLRIKATVPVPATLGLFGLGLAGLGILRRNTA